MVLIRRVPEVLRYCNRPERSSDTALRELPSDGCDPHRLSENTPRDCRAARMFEESWAHFAPKKLLERPGRTPTSDARFRKPTLIP